MGRYLKFYEDCMKTGLVPGKNGLCQNFEISINIHAKKVYDKNFALFTPTTEEIIGMRLTDYWADENCADCGENFGPIRQNIVLLMAAMNNELH